jgi:hypothetical protein
MCYLVEEEEEEEEEKKKKKKHVALYLITSFASIHTYIPLLSSVERMAFVLFGSRG